jgi:hypothetical protein
MPETTIRDFVENATREVELFVFKQNCGSAVMMAVGQVKASLGLVASTLESGGDLSGPMRRLASSFQAVPASGLTEERGAFIAGASQWITAWRTQGQDPAQPAPPTSPSIRATARFHVQAPSEPQRVVSPASAREQTTVQSTWAPAPNVAATPDQAPPTAAQPQRAQQAGPTKLSDLTFGVGAQAVEPLVLFAVIKKVAPRVCPRRKPTMPLPRMLEIACAYIFRDDTPRSPETELIRYQYAHFCAHGKLDLIVEEKALPSFVPNQASPVSPEPVLSTATDQEPDMIDSDFDDDLDADLFEGDADLDADLDAELDVELERELDAVDAELDAAETEDEHVNGNDDDSLLATVQPEPTPVASEPVTPASDPASGILDNLPEATNPAAARARQILQQRAGRQAQKKSEVEARAAQDEAAKLAAEQAKDASPFS